MDVPVALALAAGYARGAWNTVADAGPIYFDGVATLVFLLIHLVPGDPVQAMLGENASPAETSPTSSTVTIMRPSGRM